MAISMEIIVSAYGERSQPIIITSSVCLFCAMWKIRQCLIHCKYRHIIHQQQQQQHTHAHFRAKNRIEP